MFAEGMAKGGISTTLFSCESFQKPPEKQEQTSRAFFGSTSTASFDPLTCQSFYSRLTRGRGQATIGWRSLTTFLFSRTIRSTFDPLSESPRRCKARLLCLFTFQQVGAAGRWAGHASGKRVLLADSAPLPLVLSPAGETFSAVLLGTLLRFDLPELSSFVFLL